MTPALPELVALLQGQLEQIVRLYDDGQSVVQLAGNLYHAKEIASAGIESIAAWNTRATQPARDSGLGEGWLQSGGLLYRLTDDRKQVNRDEIRVTMANGSHTEADCTARANELRAALAIPSEGEGA